MEFNDCLNMRKTIRKFENMNVKIEEIHKIIDSALIAPSAKNRQPWRFYILDHIQKQTILNMMYKWDKENKNEKTSVKGSADQINMADKGILIYRENVKNPDYDIADYLSIGAAIENMSLQCVNLGLGSCWVCDVTYIETEINEYLNLPNLELISMLAIGYSAEMPERRKRLKREDVIL